MRCSFALSQQAINGTVNTRIVAGFPRLLESRRFFVIFLGPGKSPEVRNISYRAWKVLEFAVSRQLDRKMLHVRNF